ncbi:MAG: hypothetical protein J0I09_03750 [Sphingobacteriia bacterium]|nr:hypothetical protein [Sphingobacteriia bacterium]
MNAEQKFLHHHIAELPFTEGLKTVLHFHQIQTLQQLLNYTVADWHKTFPGFTYHHQHEIVEFLKSNNLLDYLRE